MFKDNGFLVVLAIGGFLMVGIGGLIWHSLN
jgi:hypothetical protein